MKNTIRLLIVLLIALLVLPAYAEEPQGEKNKAALQKTTDDDLWDFISVNNILMWMSNNGRMAHNPNSSGSGLEWPQKSAKYAIFTDGIVWGGRVQGEIRVGGATYNAGLQAGAILADGTADDPKNPIYRLFMIRKLEREEYEAWRSSTDVNLVAYAEQMRKDYNEWPAEEIGAPWVDVDNNGRYEPDFEEFLDKGGNTDSLITDHPVLPGDETIWFVSNDLKASKTANLYGAQPIGIELHTLVWAYSQTGPLSNMVFTKYTVINKGSEDLTEAYFSKWSDPDLGDAFDDFVGIDTSLSLGYVYNGLAKDEIYGIPPAAGYDFFQGPIVPSPGDSAVYNFGYRQGFANLPVSTFAYYINGSSVYADPRLKHPDGSIMMYNYMRGLLWNGRPFVDPNTGEQVDVCLAGDPTTGEGWIDGQVNSPGDRRFLMTAGPFTLAVGDTQEVVVSTIVAQGADRLSSIKVLKFYDKFAQLAFETNFDLPKAPPSPELKITQHDKRLILHWGNPATADRVEKHDDRGFAFEGYNVYQFPAEGATLADGIRLATYDLDNGVAVIFDEVIDEESGIVLQLPTQYGNDGGIIREYSATMDVLTDRPLVNNQPYYFAVTAYSYNPDPEATPRQLESTPKIYTFRPQLPDPGVRYGEKLDELIPVDHTSGTSTGFVEVVAVDPLRMTDHTYEVTFSSPGQVQTTYDHELQPQQANVDTLTVNDFSEWTLTDINTGEVKINKNRTMEGLNREYYVVDGFKIGVSGTGYYKQFNRDGFDYEKPHENHDEILLIEWEGGPEPYEGNESTKGQGGDSWMMGYVSSARVGGRPDRFGSSIKGYDVDRVVEIRWDTTNTSKGYCYLFGVNPPYRFDGYYESDLQVWDVTDPNPENHRQISYAWVERNGRPGRDMTYRPTNSADDREYFFIIDEPYSDTPKPEWSDPSFTLREGAGSMPILYWGFYLLRENYVGVYPPWRQGALYRITPKVAFAAEDKYVFTTMKSTYDKDLAKTDINEINVFPNPYYGANKRELNKYQRFVTFNHLPQRAKFKIYTISGVLVRTFEKNDGTQYATWDLQNDKQLPVASGLYYIHIEMPELGVEKILKLAIVAETQFLDRI